MRNALDHREVLTCILLGLGAARAADAQAVPPPNAQDVSVWMSSCGAQLDSEWLAIDEFHERLLTSLRKLPNAPSSLGRQVALEDGFIREIGAAASLSPECVASMLDARKEKRLRSLLEAHHVRARVPSLDLVLGDAALRNSPAAVDARRLSIKALESIAAELRLHEETRTPFSIAPGSRLRTEESAALKAAHKAIQDASSTCGADDLAMMKDRLAICTMSEEADTWFERLKLILSNLRGIADSQRSELARFVARIGAQRAADRAYLLDAITRGTLSDEQYRALRNRCIRDNVEDSELAALLPEGPRGGVLVLIHHWDDVAAPMDLARELVEESTLPLLAPYVRHSQELTTRTNAAIMLPASDLAALEAEWRSISGMHFTASQRQLVVDVLGSWRTSESPRLESLHQTYLMQRSAADAASPPANLREAVKFAVAESALADEVMAAESRLPLVLPELAQSMGEARSIGAIWQLRRLEQSLDTCTIRPTQLAGQWLPRACSPLHAIEVAQLTPDLRAHATACIASTGAARLESYKQLVKASLRTEARTRAKVLTSSTESPETRYRDLPLDLIPHSDGGHLEVTRDSADELMSQWNDWLGQCESARLALRSGLEPQIADTIVRRWLLECYPVICSIADCSVLENEQPTGPLQAFRRRLLGFLRELEDVVFKPRRTTIVGASSCDQCRELERLVNWLEIDSRNAAQRTARDHRHLND